MEEIQSLAIPGAEMDRAAGAAIDHQRRGIEKAFGFPAGWLGSVSGVPEGCAPVGTSVPAGRGVSSQDSPPALAVSADVPAADFREESAVPVKFIGVRRPPRSTKFAVTLTLNVNGRKTFEYAGRFSDPVEGALAYDAMASRHGCRTNFPIGTTLDQAKALLAAGCVPMRAQRVRPYIGVMATPEGNWLCRIKIGRRLVYVGTYSVAIDAARAYDAVAAVLGRKLNFPDEHPGATPRPQTRNRNDETLVQAMAVARRDLADRMEAKRLEREQQEAARLAAAEARRLKRQERCQRKSEAERKRREAKALAALKAEAKKAQRATSPAKRRSSLANRSIAATSTIAGAAAVPFAQRGARAVGEEIRLMADRPQRSADADRAAEQAAIDEFMARKGVTRLPTGFSGATQAADRIDVKALATQHAAVRRQQPAPRKTKRNPKWAWNGQSGGPA